MTLKLLCSSACLAAAVGAFSSVAQAQFIVCNEEDQSLFFDVTWPVNGACDGQQFKQMSAVEIGANSCTEIFQASVKGLTLFTHARLQDGTDFAGRDDLVWNEFLSPGIGRGGICFDEAQSSCNGDCYSATHFVVTSDTDFSRLSYHK